MKHLRILDRIFNVPLLLEQSKADIISQIGLKIAFGEDTGTAPSPISKPSFSSPRVGIIKVFEGMVAKGGAGSVSQTSYEGIANQIHNLINYGVSDLSFYSANELKTLKDNGVYRIGFYIDSPGGEANGIFALTDFIKSLPVKYGIETFSFSDGYMTSGAYAIASATQRIYITSSTNVGSIAAIMSLVDMTKADAAEGFEYTIIRSLDEKALYNPHEPLTQDIIDKYTERLNLLGDFFVNKVNEYRPSLSVQAIIDLKGATFFGQEAIDLQLADKVVTSLDEVISLETIPSKLTTKGNKTMPTLEELQEQLSAAKAEINTLKAAAAVAKTEGVTEERTRVLGVIKAGLTLKVPSEAIIKHIEKGKDIEDATDNFTYIADAIGKTTGIDVGGLSSTISSVTIPDPEGKAKTYAGTELAAIDNALKLLETAPR